MNTWNIKKLQDLKGFVHSSQMDGEITRRAADEIDRIISEVIDSEIKLDVNPSTQK